MESDEAWLQQLAEQCQKMETKTNTFAEAKMRNILNGADMHTKDMESLRS